MSSGSEYDPPTEDTLQVACVLAVGVWLATFGVEIAVGQLYEYDGEERRVIMGGKKIPEPEMEAVGAINRFIILPGGGVAELIYESICSLPVAQALLAKRDARIAELETKLARWRPIVRAALGEREAEEALRALFHQHGRRGASQEAADIINVGQWSLRERRDKRADAVDSLSIEERAELLKEESDG